MTTVESKSSDEVESTAAARIEWRWRSFGELTLDELYAVLRLRQRVFVVEQACAYLDLDDADQQASHLMGWTLKENETFALAAYARIFAPGVKYAESSIGRVITAPEARRTGMGKALMRAAIERAERFAPESAIRIGAQIYLERFYGDFGFRRASEPYMEDGILHIEMVRSFTSASLPAVSTH